MLHISFLHDPVLSSSIGGSCELQATSDSYGTELN